jgi:tetratricopeptide (TPR) repeat protein
MRRSRKNKRNLSNGNYDGSGDVVSGNNGSKSIDQPPALGYEEAATPLATSRHTQIDIDKAAHTTVFVRQEELPLPTYFPAPPDKNPMFMEKRVYQGSSGRVYPLPFTDRISETKVQRHWKVIWLENEYLRVMILPEIGGRIHAILDKTNSYDLIYNQKVIKPALVGLAGPWASGGIEFNWPQHHRPATFLPADYEIEEHADGSKTVWCSDHDPMCRMKGMHGVCLHPGKSLVELKVRAYNRTPHVQTFLWWANVATRVHEAYQSFFPPDVHFVADHARRSMSRYPLCEGRYYGVDYSRRARKGIPASEIPTQYVPPHCQNSKNGENSQLDYPPNDLSFYANISTPCSYMCMGSKEDFFGGYDYKAQAGIVHIASHHISPGKKQWTWGNHQFGYAWDRNLTDADEKGEFAPYIEIMAGVYTDNQPDFSFLQPGETRTWSQYWYPIQKIGPAQQANVRAAVSLRNENGTIRLGIAVTQAFHVATIELLSKGRTIYSVTRDLKPGEPFIETITPPRNNIQTNLALRVSDNNGVEIIFYEARPPAKKPVPPAATEPASPKEMRSADELYVTGLHLEQYRHATRCPTLYWREALRRDPLDSRCNNAMGLWYLRRGEFRTAESYFRKALERLTRRNANPYDCEAFYNLGLCLRYQLDSQSSRADQLFEDAYAAFYKATWDQRWASAAFHALAEMDCRKSDWTSALDHLDRSLNLDTQNLRAHDLEVMTLWKLERYQEADELLRRARELDRLDWWARYLQILKPEIVDGHPNYESRPPAVPSPLPPARRHLGNGGADGKADGQAVVKAWEEGNQPYRADISQSVVRNSGSPDLQTRLDVTHDLARAGLYCEAIELLKAGLVDAAPSPGCRPTSLSQLPDQNWGARPIALYTQGWLYEKSGDKARALERYREAAMASPDYCFPSRLEEIAILEAAMRANPGDARAPYYLGNLLYDRRRHREAIRLWERAARLNPAFSIVWRNLGIGYFNIFHEPAKARAAYDRAFRANPRDARLLFERDQLWKRVGCLPPRRLAELEKYPQLTAQRDDLSVELCALYNQMGQPGRALPILTRRKFQPWEGGEGLALGQHVRTHLALGRLALAREDYALARNFFEQALKSPDNLSEATHILANCSDIHYWLGLAWDGLDDRAQAREQWQIAAAFRGDFQEMSVRPFSEMTLYSALAMRKLGRRTEAEKLLKDLLAYSKRLAKMEAKIDYFATSLPTMLLFDDDLQFRQQTMALVLEAQARFGLGQKSRAKKLLKQVLRRDPNNVPAADLQKSP